MNPSEVVSNKDGLFSSHESACICSCCCTRCEGGAFGTQHVLSVQRSVVWGHVGNEAAVFLLQVFLAIQREFIFGLLLVSACHFKSMPVQF